MSRAFAVYLNDEVSDFILHTGQHYDDDLSEIFFSEMGIPQPAFRLSIGSLSHARQTAKMMEGIEDAIETIEPTAVLVYGDTNSTLSGALAAAKMNIPIVHVEAGLRSFNRKMPEEINRVLTDHVSTLLFSPTQTGIDNLIKEGFSLNTKFPYSSDQPGIFLSGDVMFDNTVFFSKESEALGRVANKWIISDQPYFLATIHRTNNTDNLERLLSIFMGLEKVSKELDRYIIIPLHPRTKKALGFISESEKIFKRTPKIVLIPPASFLEMFNLESHSEMIFTDSGGVQKEAYVLNKPCVVLREETEWVELLKTNACKLADANPEKILTESLYLFNNKNLNFPLLFGNGNASQFIAEKMFQNFS